MEYEVKPEEFFKSREDYLENQLIKKDEIIKKLESQISEQKSQNHNFFYDLELRIKEESKKKFEKQTMLVFQFNNNIGVNEYQSHHSVIFNKSINAHVIDLYKELNERQIPLKERKVREIFISRRNQWDSEEEKIHLRRKEVWILNARLKGIRRDEYLNKMGVRLMIVLFVVILILPIIGGLLVRFFGK